MTDPFLVDAEAIRKRAGYLGGKLRPVAEDIRDLLAALDDARRQLAEYRAVNENVRVCERSEHQRAIIDGDGCLICQLAERDAENERLRMALVVIANVRGGPGAAGLPGARSIARRALRGEEPS
jgi:hypothetical protein